MAGCQSVRIENDHRQFRLTYAKSCWTCAWPRVLRERTANQISLYRTRNWFGWCGVSRQWQSVSGSASHQQLSKTTARSAVSRHLKLVSGPRCSVAQRSTRMVNYRKKSASGFSYAPGRRRHQRMTTSSNAIAVIIPTPPPTVAWLVGSAPR